MKRRMILVLFFVCTLFVFRAHVQAAETSSPFYVYTSLSEAKKGSKGIYSKLDTWSELCTYIQGKDSGTYYVRIIGNNNSVTVNKTLTVNDGVIMHLFTEGNKTVKISTSGAAINVKGTLYLGSYGANNGLNATGHTITISNTESRTGIGSAITVRGGKLVTYSEVRFKDISANCSGAAISLLDSNSEVYINGSTFSGLSAKGANNTESLHCGGAIFISGDSSKSKLQLSGSTITSCKAYAYGGAIYNGNDSSTVIIKDGTNITNCSAGDAGGAIAAWGTIMGQLSRQKK